MGEVRFCCEGCGASLVVGQEYAGRQAKCPKCGQSSAVPAETPKAVESGPVVAEDVSASQGKELFGLKLAGAFGYPFKGSGIVLLIVATGCLAVLEFLSGLPFVWLLQVFFGGYLCAYYINVIGSSAGGEEELPDWPDFTNLWDDILRPILLFAAAFLVSLAPLIIYVQRNLWALLHGEQELPQSVVYFSMAWFLAYLPMSLLAVALFDSLKALNPITIIGAIVKIPLRYLQACVLFFLVYYVNTSLAEYLDAIAVVGLVIRVFFSLYMTMVGMRILGLIYHANAKKLGWFE